MLIWSRLGFLVIVLGIGLSFIVDELFNVITGVGNYSMNHGLPSVIAFIAAGIICWFLGRAINKPNERILVDKETGEDVVIRNGISTFFFIRMEYWGPIFIIMGIYTIFSSKPL